MSDLIKLILIKVYRSSLTIIVVLILLQLAESAIAGIADQIQLFPDQNKGICYFSSLHIIYILLIFLSQFSIGWFFFVLLSAQSRVSKSAAFHI